MLTLQSAAAAWLKYRAASKTRRSVNDCMPLGVKGVAVWREREREQVGAGAGVGPEE
jgi:hypothetical protein